MDQLNRRRFLEVTAAAAVGARGLSAGQPAPAAGKPMRLGLIIGIGKDPESAIAKVHDLGLPTCQVGVESFEPELVTALRSALDRYGVEATSLVVGGPGPEVYDFSVYKETVKAIREVASYCKQNGQNFRYETGQETPITLIRAIQDVGLDNQGVNFDVANLILYGKANPADAVDLLGPYVQGMHAKDGLYPTDPKNLGEEVPIGQGKVDFPRIIQRLKELNYRGAVTIEREISGPQQVEDVRAAKRYLEKLIG